MAAAAMRCAWSQASINIGPPSLLILLLAVSTIATPSVARPAEETETAPVSPPAGGCREGAPYTAEPRAVTDAVARAAEWLASFPEEQLRFDAAVGLWHIRRRFSSPALDAAWAHAVNVADGDEDNPLRRFWDASAAASAHMTSEWVVPTEEGARVNTNRVISEALHCAANGWRPETSHYIEGPMRDRGGFHTTHALWATHLAYRNGCLAKAEYRRIATALQDELRHHQPEDFRPQTTRDLDLYAERILMLVLTGDSGPPVARWLERLLSLQNDDGSWGIDDPGEIAYARYHATMVAAWALTARVAPQ